MRIVFMGTPVAAVPTLKRIVDDGHEVVAVWTQPDRPAGRGNRVSAPPVKEEAVKLHLPIYQPVKIKTDEARELFASHEADVCVVVAYGRILPASFLNASGQGCINVHFSLLPRWRGAAPVNWAIIAGDSVTGVTTMRMDEGLDTGAILLQRETAIGDVETAAEVTTRLAVMGADLLSETLGELPRIVPRPQVGEVSVAPLLTREMGRVEWTNSATEIERRVRGLQPSPSAYTMFNEKRLIVWRAEVVNEVMNDKERVRAAGQIVEACGERLVVMCEDESALNLVEVQPEGKRRMGVRDFLNGTRVDVGDRFV